MSYKYHERAIVYNPKNLIRLWDVAYGGYNGGKGTDHVNWTDADSVARFKADTVNLHRPYNGPSMMVLGFNHNFKKTLPNPTIFMKRDDAIPAFAALDGDHINGIKLDNLDIESAIGNDAPAGGGVMGNQDRLNVYKVHFPDFFELNNRRPAGDAVQEDETTAVSMAFGGSWRMYAPNTGCIETAGSGHHGTDFVGAASVRSGKGLRMHHMAPTLTQTVGCR